jgi:cytoskeletal protein RodZ
MSAPRRTALVLLTAVLGIALAAAITWGTSQLVRQRIGLASEPLTAGQRLLPPLAGGSVRVKTSPARAPSTTSTTSRTESSRAPSSTTSSQPTPQTTTPQTTAPKTTTPASQAPTSPPVESVPQLVHGRGRESGDSSARRDD